MAWWSYATREAPLIGSSGAGLVRACETPELTRPDPAKLKSDDSFPALARLILTCNGVLGRGGMHFTSDMWGMDLGSSSLTSTAKYSVPHCKPGISWHISSNVPLQECHVGRSRGLIPTSLLSC